VVVIRRGSIIFLLAGVFLLVSCATKRPVLYPNAYLKKVGNDVAQADIEECLRLAKEGGAKWDSGERTAKSAAGGAVVGGATGAAVGAVLGRVGRGAAAGAAGGAAGGLARGVLRSGDPDPVFRNFVERCLREKGYEPIGWR